VPSLFGKLGLRDQPSERHVVWSVIWACFAISEATDPPAFPAKRLLAPHRTFHRQYGTTAFFLLRRLRADSLSSAVVHNGKRVQPWLSVRASHRASHIPTPSAAPVVSPSVKRIGGPEGTKVFSAATNDCPMTSLTVSSSGGPSRRRSADFAKR
jgi:hypothetical protein